MDFQKLTYDISRCYATDQAGVLGEKTTNKILGWIRQRNLSNLASCSEQFDDALSNVERLTCLRQIESFFKKNAAFADLKLTKAAALQTFDKAEEICRITNKRLDHYYVNRDRLDPDINLWMDKAEAYICSVLGNYNSFLEDLPNQVRFTAGATATRSRKESLPFLKVTKRMSSTRTAFPYIQALSNYFGYGRIKWVPCVANRVEVVPKNWKTARTIACEPDGNLPLQLAFDSHAKCRLRKFGIDLSDQSRNQEMARIASISGEFATVDVKTASDTEALNAVHWLFPIQWTRYLLDVRSPCYYRDGSLKTYAKFSSMGNGTTFTTETLIFASACHAVGSKKFSVYGDDIIIETELYADLVRLLKFIGFAVNKSKSFHEGPFRESCGADWLAGHDVRPFYLREWSKRKTVIAHNVNNLVRISSPDGLVWKLCKQLSNEFSLAFVPPNDDTQSGVMVDTHTAYTLKLIVTTHKDFTHIPIFKAYKPQGKGVRVFDMRSNFLWHLNRFQRKQKEFCIDNRFIQKGVSNVSKNKLVIDVNDTTSQSRYTTSSHRYVRKWVRWIPPAAASDFGHLYGWTKYLLKRD